MTAIPSFEQAQLNVSARSEFQARQVGSSFEECIMSEGPDFRKWAARLASQAGKERDSHEVQRLMSIAEYWKRLADIDERERDIPSPDRGTLRPTDSRGLLSNGVFGS